MVDDDECILLWAVPTWAQWAAYEEAHEGDPELRAWIESSRELVTARHRILLVDAPLSPLRTGRQPRSTTARTGSTEVAAEITDEGVAALRARIGVAQPHPQPPHYLAPERGRLPPRGRGLRRRQPAVVRPGATPTAPVGAARSRPPHLVGGDTLIGEDEVTRLDDETKALMKGDPLRRRPRLLLRVASGSGGTRCARAPGSAVATPSSASHDKDGEFAGRAVHEWIGEVFAAVDGPVLSGQYRLMIRAEREKAESVGQVRRAPRSRRTPTRRSRRSTRRSLAEPDRRRGAEPRWWEDVDEGDEVGPLVKGPLRVTDMVVLARRHGHGPLRGEGPAPRRTSSASGCPASSGPTTLNVPDVQQRVHWDPEWARRAGNPAIYDYGRMRETWLIHLCTDWMGDDAWLWKLDCQFRKLQLRRRHPLDAGPRHAAST